jgi:hypothetical protein
MPTVLYRAAQGGDSIRCHHSDRGLRFPRGRKSASALGLGLHWIRADSSRWKRLGSGISKHIHTADIQDSDVMVTFLANPDVQQAFDVLVGNIG